jgi:hypothetical protein
LKQNDPENISRYCLGYNSDKIYHNWTEFVFSFKKWVELSAFNQNSLFYLKMKQNSMILAKNEQNSVVLTKKWAESMILTKKWAEFNEYNPTALAKNTNRIQQSNKKLMEFKKFKKIKI